MQLDSLLATRANRFCWARVCFSSPTQSYGFNRFSKSQRFDTRLSTSIVETVVETALRLFHSRFWDRITVGSRRTNGMSCLSYNTLPHRFLTLLVFIPMNLLFPRVGLNHKGNINNSSLTYLFSCLTNICINNSSLTYLFSCLTNICINNSSLTYLFSCLTYICINNSSLTYLFSCLTYISTFLLCQRWDVVQNLRQSRLQ
jgi:hypothetical protein